jgi:hypothetical protein
MLDIAIPSELLQIRYIHLLPFAKKSKYPPIAELQYISPELENKPINCTILTPILSIEEWNSFKGRLKLNSGSDETNDKFKFKLDAIQEYIISSLVLNQESLLGEYAITSLPEEKLSNKDINDNFKRFFDGQYLTCYISPHHLFPLYVKGNRVGLEDFHAFLRAGQKIKLILQLNGVSKVPLEYLNSISGTNDNYSFRIQHQILGAYIID